MAYNWADNLLYGGAFLPENTEIAPLATLTASDDGVDAVSYGITTHSYGNLLFKIDNNGILSPTDYLQNYENSLLDYASVDRHFSAVVNAYSAEGEVVTSRLFVLTLQDVDDENIDWVQNPAIYGDNGTIVENTDPATVLAVFSAYDDAGATIDYSFDESATTDSAYFNIDATTGALTAKSAFNFEDPNHDNLYHIQVIANSSDGSLSLTQDFRITVTNVDEVVAWQTNPTGNAGEVLENLAIGTAVATFAATDPEGTGAVYGLGAYFIEAGFGLDGGSQGEYFNIDASTGVITIKSVLDFEDPNINGHYTLSVLSQATPTEEKGLGVGVISHTFILTISDTGGTYEPSWSAKPNGATIAENNSINDLAANFWARDRIDGTTGPSAVSYSLSGADAEYFAIPAGNQSSTVPLTVKSTLDYEEQQYYSVVVNAYDTNDSLGFGPALSQLFILTLTNVNEFETNWAVKPFAGGSLNENNAENVGPAVFNATDGDAVAVTYSLSGDDVDYFSLNANTGEFYLKSSLNFEDPDHGNGLYSVTVNATSTDGNAISQTVILTVTDIVEEPAQWENNGNPTGGNLSENNATGVSLADFNAVDVNGDGISYSISNLGDGSYFAIDSITGVLSAKKKFDYEDRAHYSVFVQAQSVNEEGSNGIAQQIFVLTIDNRTDETSWLNSASNGRPSSGTTIQENNAVNREVEDVGANTGVGVAIQYGLKNEGDAAYFAIANNNGKLRVNRTFDYENLPVANQDRYSVVIVAYQHQNYSNNLSEIFILTIADVNNEAVWTTNPTGNTISENIAIGTSVADFDAVNYDYEEKADVYYGLGSDYGFDGGHQDAYFNLNLQTGVLTTKSELDFENTGITTGHYTILALSQAAEGKRVISELFILTIADVDETIKWESGGNPTGNAIDENNPATTSLADFGASDTADNSTITYSLATGGDSANFTIDADTGELSTISSLSFEFTTENPHNPRYSVVVIATETATDAAATSQTFILTINNVGEDSYWRTESGYNPAGANIDENTASSTTELAQFVAGDIDNSSNIAIPIFFSYSLGGDDAALFNIANIGSDGSGGADAGKLYLKSTLDFETKTHHSVIITAHSSDGSPDITRLFILTVNDLAVEWESGGNPTGKAIDENNPATTSIADFGASDIDGATVTYSLSGGDSANFAIDATTGELSTSSSLNFEDSPRYSVVVIATDDADGDATSQTFILTINNVDEAVAWQTNPTGNAFEVLETSAIGTLLAGFNAIDPEGGAAYYGLGSDYGFDGGHQDAYFNLDLYNGQLSTKSLLDFETLTHYTILALSQAAAGNKGVASQLFILTITDVDNTRGWANNTPDGITLPENLVIGAEVYNINALSAATGGGGITFGISGTDADYFNIGQRDGVITFASVLDFENPANADNLYSIIIHSSATIEGTEITRNFVLTITDESIEWQSGGNPTGNTIAENNSATTPLVTFGATDTDGAIVTYSLSGGDSANFTIDADTGELSTSSSLNFEDSPRYSVVVIATDDADGDATSQTFILTVTNVDEQAQWQTNPTGNTISENITIGTSVADFDAIDPEGAGTAYYGLGVSYGFAGGHQDDYFNINISTGELTTKSYLDFENLTHYTLKVLSQAAEGNKGVAEHTFILTITDVDEPTGNTISENLAIGTSVADFDGINPQGNAIINYSLTHHPDAEYFKIDSNGVLTTKSVLDFESQVYYSVIVTAQVHGDDTPAVSQHFVLTIADVNNTRDWNAGTATGVTRNENTSDTTLWDYRNDDNGGDLPAGVTITYGLSGEHAGDFTIGPREGGFWRFRGGGDYDFESDYGQSINNRYSVIITANATEEGDAISRLFILTIGDVNDINWVENPATYGDNGNIVENNDPAIALATFNATDDDAGATVTYGFDSATTDADYFNIDASTGILTVKSAFDFEHPDRGGDNSYHIRIIANSDDASPAVTQDFRITVTNESETTGWGDNPDQAGTTISENLAIGTSLADFNATDGDGTTVSYWILAGDAEYFEIDSATGILTTKSEFDFETPAYTTNRYSVLVRAQSDGGDPVIEQIFILTIADENNTNDFSAGGTSLTISENNVVSFDAADRIDDYGNNGALPSGVSITYGLSAGDGDAGDDAAYFSIDAGTGWLFVTSSLDFENPANADNSYSVTIIANANLEGTAVTRHFVLNVADITVEPALWQPGGNPSGATLAENNTVGTSIADFNAIDDDATDSIDSYSLQTGNNDDIAYFGINAATGVLSVLSALDHETQSHYSVVVVATSTDASTITQTFILTITNINDNTTGWGDNPDQIGATISENLAIGTSLADFNATDGDSGTTVTYSAAATLGDGEYFAIDSATGILTTTSSFNFENPANATNRYSVLVYANSDDASPAITQVFVLTIADENEPVEWVRNRDGGYTSFPIGENGLGGGENVFLFSAIDVDAGASVTYSLGGPDASYFVLNNEGSLTVGVSALDFEDPNHGIGYSIFVTAHSTNDNTTLINDFVLTLQNVNDEPTTWADGGNPTGTELAENNAVNANLGAFITADTDNPGSGDSHTYLLTGDDANFFHLTQNGAARNLRVSESFDFENPAVDSDGNARLDNLYTVVVNARDTAGGVAVGDGLLHISQQFVLTITNIENEPIVWVNAISDFPAPFPEHGVTADTTSHLFAFKAVDGDGLPVTYSLGGPDASYFSLTDEGTLRIGAVDLDYEDPNHGIGYSIVVIAHSTDDNTTLINPFVLTISNSNDEATTWLDGVVPSGAELAENNAVNAVLAGFITADADNPNNANVNTQSYWLTGADADSFLVTKNAAVRNLRVSEVFDFENPTDDADGNARLGNRYTVVVNARDTFGGVTTVDGATGDGLLHISQLFILTITDGDDPIVFAKAPGSTINLAENNNPNDVIFVYSAYDGDANVDISYSINAGSTGDNYFSINSETGQLYAKSSFDFEDSAPNSIQVTVIANSSDESVAIANVTNFNITDVDGAGLAPDPTTPDQPVGLNGKILFDGNTDNIGGINDGIGNDGLVIIGNDLTTTQYDSVSATNITHILNNPENFADSFLTFTDADGNEQNHWFFVRDDATDNTGHIVFDADGLDVNLDSLSQGGATPTPDQINLLAGINFETDGDFAKPDDLDLNLNNNSAASLTHDQFLALIGGSNNIDFI